MMGRPSRCFVDEVDVHPGELDAVVEACFLRFEAGEDGKRDGEY